MTKGKTLASLLGKMFDAHVAEPRPTERRLSLEERIRNDKRVEDLSHDGDGWWCYLAHGLHTDQGRGSHLIHEDTLTAVLKELRQYKRSTHSCDCEECVEALALLCDCEGCRKARA